MGSSYIYDYSSGSANDLGGTLTLNAWHDVEIHFDHDAGAYGEYTLYLDDVNKGACSMSSTGSSSKQYTFANNAYGNKYYDNVQLTEREPGAAMRSFVIDALWETGFDEGYLVDDWMDHEATYAPVSYTHLTLPTN